MANVLRYSQNFDLSPWFTTFAAVAYGTVTDPLNGATGTRLTQSAADGMVQQYVTFTTTSDKSCSVYLKYGNVGTTEFGIYNITGLAWEARFRATWTAGVPVITVVQGTGSATGVTSLGNGWYRCYGTATSVTYTNTNTFVVYATAAAGGVNGNYVDMWGAQVQEDATLLDYAVTDASNSTPAPIGGTKISLDSSVGRNALPLAPRAYDPKDQDQFRRIVMDAVSRGGDINLPSGVVYIKSPMDYGAAGDGTTDDFAAVQKCATAINAAGGGAMWLDRWYKIGSNVIITNKVSLMGIGPTLCGFTAASAKTMTVTEGPEGWRYTVDGVGFVYVDLKFGVAAVDYALGLRVVNCTFDHCTNGLYFGKNAFMVLVDNCQFIDTAKGIYYDGVGAGATSGASMRVSDCGFFNSAANGLTQHGIYIDGNSSTNPIDFHIHNCHFEDIGTAGIRAYNCTTRNFIFATNCHFERMNASISATTAGAFVTGTVYKITTAGTTNFTLVGAANSSVGTVFAATGAGSGTGTATKVGTYCVQNDGAVIWVDKVWAWTDTVLFYNDSGITNVAALSSNPQSYYFCKIDAGEIRVDTSTMYTPYEPFGPTNGSDFPTSQVVGDNAGTGRLITLRSPVIIRTDGYTTLMTNASPDGKWKATGAYLIAKRGGDGNIHIFDFTCQVSTVGSDNYLRIQLADGTASPYIDLGFPVFVGIASVRLVWIPGTSLTAHGVYSGTTPGATTTQGLYATVADSTSATATYREVQFHSVKSGATASEMTVKNLTETIVAPFLAAS